MQWSSCKAPLEEVAHVCVDVFVGRAAQPVVLVRVPLKEERRTQRVREMTPSRLLPPDDSPSPQSPPAAPPELQRSIVP